MKLKTSTAETSQPLLKIGVTGAKYKFSTTSSLIEVGIMMSTVDIRIKFRGKYEESQPCEVDTSGFIQSP